MGGTPRDTTTPPFWRCGSCGTPNPRVAYLTHCLGCGRPRDACDQEAPGTGRPSARRRLGRWLAVISWAYLASLVVVALLQNGLGDRWWAATILLYGPRWAWGAPLAVLVPAALCLRPRALATLGLSALLLAGPVMGVCVPWRRAFDGRPGVGATLRVLTCNTQGSKLADPRALGDLIEEVRADLVFLQEWDPRHEASVFRTPGWSVHAERGLGLASRFPIRRVEVLDLSAPGLRGLGGAVRYVLEAPGGPLLVANLHLETPREGLEAVRYGGLAGVARLERIIAVRRDLSGAVRRFVERDGIPAVVAGDFNLTADGAIYRESWSPYWNAFSESGLGFGYTRYTERFGARIDHVLAGPGWRPRRCRVGPDVGSDHRPVIAELRFEPSRPPKDSTAGARPERNN